MAWSKLRGVSQPCNQPVTSTAAVRDINYYTVQRDFDHFQSIFMLSLRRPQANAGTSIKPARSLGFLGGISYYYSWR